MENNELKDYVRMRLGQGASREVIINDLKNVGWDDATLAELFESSNNRGVQEQKETTILPSVEPVIEQKTEPTVSASPEATTEQINIQKVPVSGKIGKFKASQMIALGSWNILKKDKEMMLFPVCSMVANFLATLVFMAFFFFVLLGGNWNAVNEGSSSFSDGLYYLTIFSLYLVSYFIVTFFEIGIVSITHGRINGQDLSFQDGLNAAKSRVGKILVWSVVAATIGMILRTVAERSKLLGKIVVWLLGSMWSILTYFIVPVLFLENLSIKHSLKKSTQVITTSWGETAIVNIGVGLVFFLLGIGGIIILMIPLILLHNSFIAIIFTIIILLYLVVLSIISSTLNTIFKVVLYEYATKRIIPQGFTEELLASAFQTKEK